MEVADSLKDAVRDYRSYLLGESGLAMRTVHAYLCDVWLVVRAMREAGDERPSDAWEAGRVREAISRVRGTRKTPSSVHRLYASLRHFEEFCVGRGSVSRSAVGDLPPLALRRTRERAVSPEAFWDALWTLGGDSERELRDRALLELLIGAGVKVSELVRLPSDALSPVECTLRVRNAHGEKRILLLPGRAVEAVRDYLRFRLTVRGVVGPLMFPGGAKGRLSERTVQRAVAGRLRVMAKTFRVTPQRVRECIASWRLAQGASRSEVQELLGLRTRSTVGYPGKKDEEKSGGGNLGVGEAK